MNFIKDHNRRFSEGWQFKDSLIVRIPEGYKFPHVFKTDEEAVAFVSKMAAEGSEYHIECLKHAMIRAMKS